MFIETHVNVVTALQASIAPVTLISGIGFLSLVTANRYGRVVDRIRALLRQIHQSRNEPEVVAVLHQQVQALYKRANNLRIAAVMGGASIFCVALTIFMIFANMMFLIAFSTHIAEFAFLLSLVLLLGFTMIFIHDFGIALHAVKFEINSFANLSSSQPSPSINLLPLGEEP